MSCRRAPPTWCSSCRTCLRSVGGWLGRLLFEKGPGGRRLADDGRPHMALPVASTAGRCSFGIPGGGACALPWGHACLPGLVEAPCWPWPALPCAFSVVCWQQLSLDRQPRHHHVTALVMVAVPGAANASSLPPGDGGGAGFSQCIVVATKPPSPPGHAIAPFMDPDRRPWPHASASTVLAAQDIMRLLRKFEEQER